MAKKALTWAFVAFLVFFIAYRPATAAATTKNLGATVMEIGTGFGDFFTRLVG